MSPSCPGRPRSLPLVALVALGGLGPLSAVAQAAPAAALTAPATAAAAPAPEEAQADGDPIVQVLGARLRCPVCQGMAIGESPAPMAQDMMRQVRALRASGQSEEQIVAYFTSRYGKWVLLDPPKEGFALLLWMLPPAALFIAVGASLGGVAHRRAMAKASSSHKPEAAAGLESKAQSARLAAVRRAVQQ